MLCQFPMQSTDFQSSMEGFELSLGGRESHGKKSTFSRGFRKIPLVAIWTDWGRLEEGRLLRGLAKV